jgi:Skp family chaperone for outer membrane proteins
VRIHRNTAGILAVLLVVCAAQLCAQPSPQGPPAAGGASPASAAAHHGVAVIDINYILEKYSRFQQAFEGWKREMEATGATLKKEEDAIMRQMESMKTLKPGTKEFKNLEEDITRKKSDLQINASLKDKEFKERAAKLQLAAYQEITEAVKNYADRSGIALVLQFNGAPVDQNNPRAVQMDIQKFVVYQNGIDITPIILDDLNRRAASTATRQPPRQAAPPATKVR